MMSESMCFRTWSAERCWHRGLWHSFDDHSTKGCIVKQSHNSDNIETHTSAMAVVYSDTKTILMVLRDTGKGPALTILLFLPQGPSHAAYLVWSTGSAERYFIPSLFRTTI
ncbi:hypothetical protein Tco_0594725 [Tanacetum coccineum]